MAQFPKSESQIAALAHAMVTGLSANVVIYPNPPVTTPILEAALTDLTAARDAAVGAQAAAAQAVDSKDSALAALAEAMRKNLRYAELCVGGDDAKLQLIGWGGKSAGSALTAPGQCRSLEAPRQGEGWVFLDWKEPLDGGKVAAYKIQRRERPAGEWADVAMAMESEITLNGQARAKELEFRVLAVNKAGEGEASNSVLAVL